MQHNLNRLVNEKSPYLLQHAHNPVDWYPWGNEAFEKAKGEDKPIFLSIGYSTAIDVMSTKHCNLYCKGKVIANQENKHI